MKKKNTIFLLTLFAVLIIIGGCIGKADRTFGPITLSITSDTNNLYMGNTVTLKANLGFPDYSWEIVSATHGCSITSVGNDQAVLYLADDANETYTLSIKVSDSKGNSKKVDYQISRVPIKMVDSSNHFKYDVYSKNSNDIIYISINPNFMPDFSNWVIDSGPGTIDNPNTYATTFHSNGGGVTGLTKIHAETQTDVKSMSGNFIVYDSTSVNSTAKKDGYITHIIATGTNIASASDTQTFVGYNASTQKSILRSFFSFDVPSVGTIYKGHISLRKFKHTPSNIFDNNRIYLRFIGKDKIPSAGLESNIYDTLNDDVTSPGYFYFYNDPYSQGTYCYFDFSAISIRYDYNPDFINDINYCRGGALDIGLRFENENFSGDTTKVVVYYTSDYNDYTPYQPWLFIYYY